MSYRSIDELRARQDEIRERMESMTTESRGRVFTDDEKGEWNALGEELDKNEVIIAEWAAREEVVARFADNSRAIESPTFNTSPRRPENIYDLVAIRQNARNLEEEVEALRSNALRALDEAQFPHPEANREDCQTHVDRLIERFAESDDGGQQVASVARRILSTGSLTYRRAFGKAAIGKALTPDESRALAVTGSAGGYAVPFTLDPTIIPTSNLSVNPFRAIARVETIATTTWNGVSSAGVTATYGTEVSEATDASPTLVQPTATPVRAQVTIPFSLEIQQDWGSMQSEMAALIQDAKDDVEATKFTTGSGTNEPQGVLTGATTVVTTAGTAAFAVADLYALQNALPPRFRPRGKFVGNLAIYNLIRGLDTAGGGALWVQLQQGIATDQVPTPGPVGASLLGQPAYEDSAMKATTATNDLFFLYGDFRYFLIVDRIGMDLELVPHLFGSSRMPLGQRAIYAFWRNTSVVLSANAFRVLKAK